MTRPAPSPDASGPRLGKVRRALGFFALNFEEAASCVGMAVIIAVISVNVCLRYFFSRSIPWAEEISVIAFSCVIFLGSAAVFKRGLHIGIDVVINFAPAPVRAAAALFTSAFMVIFNAYVAYLGWVHSVESWDKPTSILYIPYFFVNLPICLGFASMTAYSVRDLLARWRGGGRGGP